MCQPGPPQTKGALPIDLSIPFGIIRLPEDKIGDVVFVVFIGLVIARWR